MARILAYIKPVSDTAPLARERALVVLARYPRAGQVKSRLASSIGETEAADLYRAFLVDIRRRLALDVRWSFQWAFAPADSPFVPEVGAEDLAFVQSGGDLGERMSSAIATVIAGGFRHVVLIGSDVPHLDIERIDEAFETLARGAPLVLGPAEDGGYYLIGVRDVVPPVFDGISWGSESVFRDTLAAAERAGLSPVLLAPTYDVDTVADLERLWRDVESGRARDLDATREVLERLIRVRYT